MADSTKGAVHLTSLSLDLTQFNENIKQIEESTAQVADIAVQNLDQIKNALNFPVEQMNLSVNTTELKQQMDSAQESVDRLGTSIKTVSTDLKSGQMFTTDMDSSSLSALTKQLGLTGNAATSAEAKLKSLFEQIQGYDKVQISSSGGELFKAVVTSSDEAGNSIRKVIDLTKEITSETVASSSTVTDNVEKRNNEIKKINQALVNSFEEINTQYTKLAGTINKTKLDDVVKQEFLSRVNEAQASITTITEKISGLNQIASADSYLPSFDNLKIELESVTKELETATKAQDEYLAGVAKQKSLESGYEKLETRIASLIATMSKMKLDTPEWTQAILNAKDLEERIVEASSSIKTLEVADDNAAKAFADLANEVNETDLAIKKANLSIGELQKFERLSAPLKELNSQYEKLKNNINKSNLDDFVKQEYIDKIQSAQEGIQKLTQDIYEMVTIASAGDFDKEIGQMQSTLSKITNEFQKASDEKDKFLSSEKQAQQMANDFERLQSRLAGMVSTMTAYNVKVDMPEIDELITKTKLLEQEAAESAEKLRTLGSSADITEDSLKEMNSQVVQLNTSFQKAKTGVNEYDKLLAPIKTQAEGAVSSLKALEKATVFQTSKQKVAELRVEYEAFLTKLKTTNISADAAKSELEELQKKFTNLEGSIKKGNATLENWVNKISESAKWQIANSALNLLQQSFGQLTNTIIETENATIELRRVLNDKSLVDSDMAGELYDIAYEFGQTFDAVQEVAVKFAQTGLGWEDTIEATRATMLALNTAELEVSSATEGLIAVMAQFGIEADDLEAVIDKINKTADNFPITSEKIVAALQRAGGTANAFGLSLEETIGIITALGEATGRAGEAIGTAMNSLIQFSMKDSALEKFSEFLGKDVSNMGVLEIWQELAVAIEEGDEAIAAMMATSEEFEDFLDEDLATAIGLTDEYTKAVEETNQAISSGKDIYATVGTYRQNYFIALLNNIDTAIAAIQGMDSALGYSLQENKTAMEAFSRQWNQLVISAEELAVQIGNAGFLDMMKWAVSATSDILQLTQSLGGLQTAMFAVGTIFAIVKKEKINSYFASITTAVGSVKNAISLYKAYMATGATATQAMSAAVGTLQLSLGGVIAVIGVAVTAISAITGAIEKSNQKAKEALEQNIAKGEKAIDQAVELAKAYKEYSEALNEDDLDSLNKTRETMLDLMGDESVSLSDLTEKYEDLDAVIKTLAEDEYIRLKQQVESGRLSAYENLKNIELPDTKEIRETINNILSDEMYDLTGGADLETRVKALNEIIANLGVESVQTADDLMTLLQTPTTNIDEATKKIKTLTELLSGAYNFDNLTDAQRVAIMGLIDIIAEQIDTTEEAADEAKKYDDAWKKMNPTLEESADEIANIGEKSEDTSEKLDGASTSTDNFTLSQEELEKRIEDTATAISNLNKKIDTFQSSYKTLTEIVESYNETGTITADQLQTLMGLEPEYIQLLENKNGQLVINKNNLNDLIAANDNYIIQMAALKIEEAAETLIKKLSTETTEDMTVAQIEAAMASEMLGGELAQAAVAMLTGKDDGTQLNKVLDKMGEEAGIAGNQMVYLKGKIDDTAVSYKSLIGLSNTFSTMRLSEADSMLYTNIERRPGETGSEYRERVLAAEKKAQEDAKKALEEDLKERLEFYTGPGTTSGSGSGSSSTDPYKAEKDALNELLEIYEHSIFLMEKNGGKAEDIAAIYIEMQKAVHAQAEKYRAAGLDDTSEEIRNLQTLWWQYQESIEEVLHGIYEETVASHENAIKMLEYQYDDAEQRMDYSYMGENLKEQLDYHVKIQREAEKELERLAKQGIDVNDDAAQDVIDTWYDARDAIREISQQIQESILQPYDDFIDLADKFDLWDYMDFTKVDYLRDELTAINKLLEDGTMTLKEYTSYLKDIAYALYEAQKERMEKQQDEISARKDEVVAKYNADIADLNQQKQDVEDYYASVIDGYNAEIDVWEARKDEVSDYYDKLIDNLNEVQEANERINAQVDYYNSRQKIITNLEQAQARSGVEWREKEMEYQQQLIDLDEDWRRTQEDWNIEDQIEALEKLKELALADIELSIQAIRDTITAAEEAKTAAIEAIEAEIAGIEEIIDATEKQAEEEIAAIEEDIKGLSEIIANAIKDGSADGLINSQAEFDKALVDGTNALLAAIDSNNAVIADNAAETANSVYGAFDIEFLSPMGDGINNIVEYMQTAIPTGASSAAQQALVEFDKSLITPLKQEMASLMLTSDSLQKSLTSLSASYDSLINLKKGPITTSAITPKLDTSSGIAWKKPGLTPFAETATNVFITNNNVGMNTNSIISKNQQQLMQQLGLGK